MAIDLMEYLAGRQGKQFSPSPVYSRDGDFLTFFFRDEDAIAKRVDELLTVYLASETGELVGAKIKGVKRILDTLGNFSTTIKDGPLTLGMIFLAGMAVSREVANKNEYIRVGEFVKAIEVDAQELLHA